MDKHKEISQDVQNSQEDIDIDSLTNLIDFRHDEDVREAKTEQDRKNDERNECLEKIKALKNPIQKLIKLMEHAEKKKVDYINPNTKGDNKSFYTDHFYHRLGFFPFQDKLYIGIMNGGWNGSRDFLTNGKDIFAIWNDVKEECHKKQILEPRVEDMKRFLNEFDEFKDSFISAIKNQSVSR